MGDGLDMDLDQTAYQMKALSAIADDLAAARRTARADIEWLAGTLGRGPLGTGFLARYRPAEAGLNTALAADQERTTGLAAAGAHCVDVYATADAHAEAELLKARFK